MEPGIAIEYTAIATPNHLRYKPCKHDFVAHALLAPAQQTAHEVLFRQPRHDRFRCDEILFYESAELLARKGTRDQDRMGVLKEAAKSQLSYFKLAVLGGRKKD